jgi:putative IMPACT (imprinted ancient) family translation regulator
MTDTLAAPAAFDLEARHSRFRAQAAPVASIGEAQAWVAATGDPGATHHCWAWRVGDAYRSSDDGEPAGTAGRPILAAIDGQGCDRVAVVVTRWYGGIKLGAGGLVRAYGGAAAECLRRAERVPIVAMRELGVRAAFEDLGAVHAALAGFGAEKLDERFDAAGVQLRLALPADRADALRAHLRDATRDRVQVDAAAGG